MSLRLRLNLLLGALNLGFLIALTALLLNNQKDSIAEEIVAAHRVTVQMLQSAAQSSLVMGPAPVIMADMLERLGRVRANEIRLYTNVANTDHANDGKGSLRYTSPSSPYKAGRNAPDWFAQRMSPPMSVTVIDLPGARIEVLPDASRAVLDAWDNLTAVALLGTVFFVVLHGSLLLFLRRLLQPTEDDQLKLVATTQALAENREVTNLIQTRVEEERKRLSRELHDELGQSVTAIRLIATSIARSIEAGKKPQGAEKISEIAAGLYDGVQRIVRELRPAVLEQPDLGDAMAEIAREWRTRHPDIALHLELEGDCGDLGEAITLTLFRAVQEALTNVLKHATASEVRIHIANVDGSVTATIEDDGRGNSIATSGSRQGLAGMKERVAALHGTLAAGPRAEGGFRVSIRLPLNGESL
jgi:two-component system sensor histidine kinase UhpB